jgi:chromosome segregation ATPase
MCIGVNSARDSRVESKLALPDAPADVAAAASKLWELALAAAEAQAKTHLAESSEQLEQARADLDADRAAFAAHQQRLEAMAADAAHALTLAEARLAEHQTLMEHQRLHQTDLTRQRDDLAGRVQALTQSNTEAQNRLLQQELAASAERDVAAAHIKATEDRAYSEVDRAREESKALRAQVGHLQREHAQLGTQLTRHKEESIAAKHQLERDLARLQARNEVLEEQLKRATQKQPSKPQIAPKHSAASKPRAATKKRSS